MFSSLGLFHLALPGTPLLVQLDLLVQSFNAVSGNRDQNPVRPGSRKLNTNDLISR